jgi:hypothetical protein
MSAEPPPPGWLAVVADAAHRIIARSEQEDTFIGTELPPAQWHRPGPGGVFEFTDSEGRPSLEASATSELTGWETAVWAPKALLVVDLDYAPSGLTWRLTCPAANALEPSEREQNSGESDNRTEGASGRAKVRTTA